MQPPRATVNQAIEFLKFHQLRKENTAVFEKVTSLHDNASSMREEMVHLRKDIINLTVNIDQLKKSQIAKETETEKLKCHIDKIDGGGSALQQSLSDMKMSFEKDLSNERALRSRLEAENTSLENRVKPIEIVVDKNISAIQEAQKHVERALENKVETTEIVALKEQLAELKQLVNDFQRKQELIHQICSGFESSHHSLNSGVGRSISARNTTLKDPPLQSNQTAMSERVDVSAEQSSIQGEEMMLSIENPEQPVLPVSPVKTGTTSAVRGISYIIHDTTDVRQVDVIPRASPLSAEKHSFAEELLSLRQRPCERVSEYMGRTEILLKLMPLNSEAAFLKRFLKGLHDQKHSSQMQSWLDCNTWTLNNAKECIRALEESEESQTARPLEPSNGNENVEHGQNSENVESNENQNDTDGDAMMANETLLQNEPRRSRRLKHLEPQHAMDTYIDDKKLRALVGTQNKRPRQHRSDKGKRKSQKGKGKGRSIPQQQEEQVPSSHSRNNNLGGQDAKNRTAEAPQTSNAISPQPLTYHNVSPEPSVKAHKRPRLGASQAQTNDSVGEKEPSTSLLAIQELFPSTEVEDKANAPSDFQHRKHSLTMTHSTR